MKFFDQRAGPKKLPTDSPWRAAIKIWVLMNVKKWRRLDD
jgi:hypothetical protein